jgi:hypothetical protein
MRNENIANPGTNAMVKITMMRVLRKLGPTTPKIWEQAVFRALTGHAHDEVDWDFEDNQAGYYLWIKTFDGLVEELVEDGHVRFVEQESGRALEAVEA